MCFGTSIVKPAFGRQHQYVSSCSSQYVFPLGRSSQYVSSSQAPELDFLFSEDCFSDEILAESQRDLDSIDFANLFGKTQYMVPASQTISYTTSRNACLDQRAEAQSDIALVQDFNQASNPFGFSAKHTTPPSSDASSLAIHYHDHSAASVRCAPLTQKRDPSKKDEVHNLRLVEFCKHRTIELMREKKLPHKSAWQKIHMQPMSSELRSPEVTPRSPASQTFEETIHL